VNVDDMGEIITGGTPSTKKDGNYGGNIPFIRVSDFGPGPYIQETGKKITKQGLEEVRNKELPTGAVMVSCIGTGLGKTAINEEDSVTNQQINSIITGDEFDKWYVYYKLTINQDKLQQYAGGSAQPILSKSKFSNIELDVHQYSEQKKIGKILSQIDKKISLNDKINRDLQEVTKALFNYWFTDFEPYEEFRESSVGQIPESFDVLKMGDVCSTRGGGTPSTDEDEYWGGDNLWLTPKEVTSLNTKIVLDTERKISDEGLDNSSAKIMPEKSILLTSRATVGEVAVNREPMGTNQGFICIRPNERVEPYFLSCVVENRKPEIESRASGSTYDEISQTSFNEIEIAVPPKEDIERFESRVEDLYEEIYTRELENRKLEALRDALLPKLMSGEIRVNDIELDELEVDSEV
jgi:type I restriction enzyme S subunit